MNVTGNVFKEKIQNLLIKALTCGCPKRLPYPGELEAIIDRKTWDAAQKLLKTNLVHDGRRVKRVTPLRGLVKCGCCGGPMVENFTKKKQCKHYRYFICDHDAKRLHSTCPVKRVPAAELESLLLSEIGTMLAKPEILAGILHSAAELNENGKQLKMTQVQAAFSDLVNVRHIAITKWVTRQYLSTGKLYEEGVYSCRCNG